ncbi:fibroblast growth factor 5 [Megalops cyprinoides]|uniref:fibroblast growth factor 5 n=1 Tax=Megalops cyprinoides TaxID=118141 RepID=UPI00186402A9|nr:fibroblast growth factor 5 [Megalops cyprinoides]
MAACCSFFCLVLLAACVSRHRAGADAGYTTDHGSRLRIRWQVSMRESRLSSKAGLSPPHPIRAAITRQLLYCRVGIGYHLHILPNGTVGGVHEPNEYSWLKVFAMRQGVVGIQGLKTGLYLCMDKEGISRGSDQFTADCLFRESLEENHYTTYSSVSHSDFYLALSNRGEAKRGNSVRKQQPCTHFLPRWAH